MKKQLLSAIVAVFTFTSSGQTTLYTENFESGNSFTLNSTDLGGATTYNTWLMNNIYAGGSGTFVCLGFPFSFTVANTPTQPVGITNAPSSNYMHITAQAAASSGINCASYIPADGTCVTTESNFTKMTNPVSTVGYGSVSFDFWWMCAGSADAYGQVYYSLDGGTTWVLKQNNMNNVTNWAQMVLTDAAWDNQPSIKFAFRFVNNTASNAADPAFSVDEIEISGMPASNSITTSGTILQTSWCQGTEQIINVDFVSAGTYNGGNVYTAQISDGTGSFASPLAIGSLASSASGALSINAVAPLSLVAGSGYRIRVVASDPAVIGTDNGANLVIYPLPVVTLAAFNDVCEDVTPFALTGGAPTGGTYMGIGVFSGNFDPLGPGQFNITYTYVDGNGCSNSVANAINVNALPTVTLAALGNICDNAGALTLTGGTPAGGVYSGSGVTGGMFDPAAVGAGTYTISYSYSDANNCTGEATQTITVDGCSSLDELSAINAVIFPNPTDGTFTINGVSDITFVDLVDLSGKVIERASYSGSSFSVKDVTSGVYILMIHTPNGVYQSKIQIK